MKDQVVLITGGSSGIGEACAIYYGLAGAKIVTTGRNSGKLTSAASRIKSEGVQDVLALRGDVSSIDDCGTIVKKTIEHYHKIDVLINNAGISMRALFDDIELEVFKKVMDINFYGTLYMTKACLPYIRQTEGSIIGVSSIAGKKGLPARTAYSASKFAMEGFLQSLRIELIHENVHIMVVSPGFVRTNIRNTALTSDGATQGKSPKNEDKLMTPGEVAKEMVVATIKRKRDLVLTLQGKTLVKVDKIAPHFADKQVYKHFANETDSPLNKKDSHP